MKRSAIALCLLLAMSAGADWAAKMPPDPKDNPAYAAIDEDPALPRVLLIGDSISVGYTLEVRRLLLGKANVLRPPLNCGPTSRGVDQIDQWLGNGKWDVIHFNFGLHDIKRMKGDKVDLAGDWQISAEQYEKNLEAIVGKLKTTGARLVWASTTPVPEGSGGRVKGEEVGFNEIAARVMQKHGVTVDDLHSHVLPALDAYQLPKNVHFKPEGYAYLGQKVAQEISKALESHSKKQ